MASILNRLNQGKVNAAKVGLHADGGGLYLQVTAGKNDSLRKSWFFRFAISGHERRMGLGALSDVSLAEARKLADAARRLHAQGIDPIAEREDERRAKAAEVVTFRRAFDAFFAGKSRTLSNAKHRDQWQSTMEAYVFPTIGDRPVAEVTTGEILAALSPIWFDKPETAKRVLQRVEAVFKSAILRGHRERASPCVGVAQELGTRHRKVAHHRALPYGEIAAFLQRLRATNGWPATSRAFEWLVLTASRSGEARLALWSEIDEQRALWTIPAERMKAKREHIVPLPPRCIEILGELRATFCPNPDDFVFPGTQLNKPLSDMTLTKVLRDLGLADKATVHGMRSAFKVWCAEVAKVRDEVSEAALAHAIPEKVRAAYLRTAFLEERKPLMLAWARYCAEPRPVDTVVPLRRAALI